jgi:AsmA protein
MARPTRRLIRIFATTVAALLLLAVAAVAALVLFVDADRFRPRIERAAGQALGRQVALGSLHWDLGRRVALASEGGSIANAPGFDAAQFASWRRISFGLALRPLLRRDVRIDHLAVEGLVLDLQRNADGQGNWVFAPTTKPGASTTTGAAEPGEGGLRIALGSLALTDATIRYRDATSARDLAMNAVNLSVSLPLDLEASQLEFADIDLDARIEHWPLSLQAAALHVDRNGPALGLPKFEATFDQVSGSGVLRARLGAAPEIEAQLHLALPSVRAQMERLGRPLSPMQDPAVPGAASMDARLLYTGGAVRLDELVLKVDDTTLDGTVKLPSLRPLVLRFDLGADRVDIDRYLRPDDVPSRPFELPVRALRSLDAKGKLRIAQAEASGVVARQAEFTVE